MRGCQAQVRRELEGRSRICFLADPPETECVFHQLTAFHPDRDALLEAVRGIALVISTKSSLAVRGTKETLNYSRDHSVADGLNHGLLDVFVSHVQTADHVPFCGVLAKVSRGFLDMFRLHEGESLQVPCRTCAFLVQQAYQRSRSARARATVGKPVEALPELWRAWARSIGFA